MRALFVMASLLVATVAHAQEADTTIVEDFSQYAEAELAGGTKRYATSKVLDQSPNKLISLGYDVQGAYDMEFASIDGAPAQTIRNNNNQGLRLAANVPVVSTTKVLINLAAIYWEHRYSFDKSQPIQNPLAQSLDSYGLRTMGINFTLFKPLNEKQFFLIQGQTDLNGNYSLANIQSLEYTRLSVFGIYGWKKHDRLMYGFGAARTFRVGELNYIPLIYYYYTAPSRKWGVESVFPARLNVRRNFNPRTLAFFGYELEGNTYRINNRGNEFAAGRNDLELRRSELRIRLTFERSIKDFLWFSVQAG